MQGLAAIFDKRGRVADLLAALESGEYMMRIITEYEAEICDMNAVEQMYEQGVNAAGERIMEYAPYSPITIEYKRAKGQPVNRVTLRDTGDFHASFYLTVEADKFRIYAGDEKTARLVQKYGAGIFGLTPQNIGVMLSEYVYPGLLEYAKEIRE